MRIVSLVPSLSATACDLGRQAAMVGCTNFCVRPAGLHRNATLIGGTKDPDLARLKELQPTHILVNEEENTAEIIAECKKIAPTFSCLPITPEDSIEVVEKVGEFLNVQAEADLYAARMREAYERIQRARDQLKKGGAKTQRFAYLVWKNPYILAASNTFVSHACSLWGWENVLKDADDRYPKISVEVLRKLEPDVLFFPSEPYPFRKRDIEMLRREWTATGKEFPRCLSIDGQLTSWWGSVSLELFERVTSWMYAGDNGLFSEHSNPRL